MANYLQHQFTKSNPQLVSRKQAEEAQQPYLSYLQCPPKIVFPSIAPDLYNRTLMAASASIISDASTAVETTLFITSAIENVAKEVFKANPAFDWTGFSSGAMSKASGEMTKANGEVTKASGELTKASGEVSKTNGEVIKANAEMSKASWEPTKAIGELTKASGEVTKASGEMVKASGELTKASGNLTPQGWLLSDANCTCIGSKYHVNQDIHFIIN